jgi:hypothetical protein
VWIDFSLFNPNQRRFTVPPAVALLNYESVSCGILWQICLPKRDILLGFSVNH